MVAGGAELLVEVGAGLELDARASLVVLGFDDIVDGTASSVVDASVVVEGCGVGVLSVGPAFVTVDALAVVLGACDDVPLGGCAVDGSADVDADATDAVDAPSVVVTGGVEVADDCVACLDVDDAAVDSVAVELVVPSRANVVD